MSKVTSMLEDSGKVFEIMLGLGLFGLMFLVVFGNLLGNLGFSAESNQVINNTGGRLNDTEVYTIPEKSNNNFTSWSVSEVWNSSAGTARVLLNTSQYVVDSTEGTIINGSNTVYPVVNITYTTSEKGKTEIDSEGVILNLTGGTVTFFSFANIWFTLLAVTVLIVIILGVIGIVRNRNRGSGSSGRKGKMRDGGFSG